MCGQMYSQGLSSLGGKWPVLLLHSALFLNLQMRSPCQGWVTNRSLFHHSQLSGPLNCQPSTLPFCNSLCTYSCPWTPMISVFYFRQWIAFTLIPHLCQGTLPTSESQAPKTLEEWKEPLHIFRFFHWVFPGLIAHLPLGPFLPCSLHNVGSLSQENWWFPRVAHRHTFVRKQAHVWTVTLPQAPTSCISNGL